MDRQPAFTGFGSGSLWLAAGSVYKCISLPVGFGVVFCVVEMEVELCFWRTKAAAAHTCVPSMTAAVAGKMMRV